MAAFLEQLADALFTAHGRALEEVAVVLPSQRAGLYLRHALAQRAGGALWSPEVFTLSSFMERLSGLRALPMEELLFEAYEAYRSVAGPDVRAFDDFLEWAPVTLADISEADAHVVRIDGFYRDLRSWEELEWSFNMDPLSAGQQRMVRYWALAGKLHVALNGRLLANGTGTSGLVERTAAEKDAPSVPWERIWFAGLNAFTAAQQRVLDRVHEAGLARFAWDADRYYLDAPQQEAGDHLRAAIKRYGPGVVPIADELRAQGPPMRVVRAPNTVAQAWCASDLLRDGSPEQRARTAVVLADEALLPALLEALPPDMGPLNITMGLSVAALPVGSLLDAFFRAHASAGTNGSWSFNDLERLLRHPFLHHSMASTQLDAVLTSMRSSRLPRVSSDHINKALAELDDGTRERMITVFTPAADRTTHTRVTALLGWAQHTMADDAFAMEQIYQASIIMRKTQRLLERYGHAEGNAAWMAVMTRLLRTARIGLFGEPLKGLQVMGLLESRALDHERIILLGAQEGKLPSSSFDRSYIPFELRRAYGLPLRDSGDAVQAYNFLRMVQRAQEVVLIHADDGTANGPSRYIAQLRHELFADRPGNLTFKHARVPVPLRGTPEVQVPNDEDVRRSVRALLEKGLSPTMLRTWLRCPLDFWFRYVRHLREPDTPGARIGGDVLGNVLHASLEAIYRPWLGHPLHSAELEGAVSGFGDAFLERLQQEVPLDLLASGQPLLQSGMAVRAAENFLRSESRAVKKGMRIVPIALELDLRAPLMGPAVPDDVRPMIKGRLDRVDERDGAIHILDLKTGRVDENALRIKELSLAALKGDKGYAAQLLLYAWLYLSSHPGVEAVRTGLQPLQRASGSEGLYLSVAGEERISRRDLPAITELLASIVRAMLDPASPYRHDPGSKYCVFCAQG